MDPTAVVVATGKGMDAPFPVWLIFTLSLLGVGILGGLFLSWVDMDFPSGSLEGMLGRTYRERRWDNNHFDERYFGTFFDLVLVYLGKVLAWYLLNMFRWFRGRLRDGYALGLLSSLILVNWILAVPVLVVVIIVYGVLLSLGALWAITYEAGADFINKE
jgi:hypothetical protein